MLNKLLERQIQKYLGTDTVPEQYGTLLKVISESYDHQEKSRKMLIRSIELSSEEMMQLNQELGKEAAKLKKVNSQIEHLFKNINEIYFSVDVKKQCIQQVSDACEKVTGYTVSEFMSNMGIWQQIVHPEDKQILGGNQEKYAKGEQIINQFRIIHKSGRICWVEMKIIPILDAERDIVRLDAIARDITERKEAEEKIERLNMLIYQISHDIRGPINSAKNYLYLASQKVTNKTALNYLEKIHFSYDKLESHLISMINLQRLNRSEISMEKIDIQELIEQVIRSIDNVNGFDKVKISIDVAVGDTILCDRQYLHSIIYNLIRNAIKYRKDVPNSFVHISSHNSSVSGNNDNSICISVSDNGKGMIEEVKLKIFEMFYREDYNSSGFGLGLYIVKSLVEQLKGKITVESELMKGTTFTICLPKTVTAV
jgi:PAS domain S-box-containing protein